ncbi:MAG TPA: hypothetical protein VEY91_05225, partial [Candidatus Limnocylindria bacterium]|nr:hypothetical protein [Candidatus Limnocylindria bacterium]
RRELWTLRSAEVLGASVRPGGTVTVRCEVERWRGGRETHTLRLPVPEEFPDGRYVLWLGGGPELTRYESERLPARYRPISLDEAWRRMAEMRTSNRLYGALIAKAPEVTAGGLDYPELPTSALAVLASGQTAGDRSRRGDRVVSSEQRVEFDGPVRGELQLEVTVDTKAR